MNPNFKSIGQKFVEQYYQTFDANRALLASLYRQQSMLTFEGSEVQGPDAIMKKLTSLPFRSVTHVITTYDTQPSVNGGVIVHVVGQLKADDDPPHAFSQTFVLLPEGDSMFVLNDMFRLSLHHG